VAKVASENKDTVTVQQDKFIRELIKGKSQRKAYQKAYPASKKWLDKTVDERASKLFKSDKVNTRYNILKERVIKAAENDCIITAKQVLQELTNVALANGSDFAEIEEIKYEIEGKDGTGTGKYNTYKAVTVKSTDEVPQNRLSAIAGIEQTNFGIRVRQHNKLRALELLGKHLNIFTEKIEISGSMVIFSGEDKLED